jgi:hypothetical protein
MISKNNLENSTRKDDKKLSTFLGDTGGDITLFIWIGRQLGKILERDKTKKEDDIFKNIQLLLVDNPPGAEQHPPYDQQYYDENLDETKEPTAMETSPIPPLTPPPPKLIHNKTRPEKDCTSQQHNTPKTRPNTRASPALKAQVTPDTLQAMDTSSSNDRITKQINTTKRVAPSPHVKPITVSDPMDTAPIQSINELAVSQVHTTQ